MDEIFISFDGSVRDNAIKLAEKIEKLLHYKVFIDKKRGRELQEKDPENEIEEKIKNVRKVILYLTKEYVENLPHKDYLQLEIKTIQNRIKKEGRKFLIILKDNKNTKLKNEIINDDVFEIFDDFLNDDKKLFSYLRRSEKFDIEKIKNKIYKEVETVGERYLPFVNKNIKNIEVKELEKINYLENSFFENFKYNLIDDVNKILEKNNIKKHILNIKNYNENLEKIINYISKEIKDNDDTIRMEMGFFDHDLSLPQEDWLIELDEKNFQLRKCLNYINLKKRQLDLIKEIYTKKKVLLIGEALIGKTHFLSNLALERINCNKPTLLFYGENLRSKTLIQSLKDNLELSVLTDEEFFNEIDLWGKDLNERVFIIIDAINETHNLDLWRNDLSKLCNYVKEYENIALILSIRDVEKEKIINDKNRHCFENEFIEIQHPGFEERETEAISKYCKAFEIDLPKIPFHIGKIFINPGMLYIFIKAIKELKINYEFNYINPLKIFNLYRKSLEKKFADKYEEDVDLDEETIKEGIDTIIKLGLDLENFEFEISYKDAIEKLKPLHKKLLDFLVSEGLFRKIKKDEKTYIRFIYQKFENFYIVNYILENDPRLINSIFKTNNYMLLEALFSLYPQKYKKEIYENYPDVLHYYFDIYKKSLYFRDPNTITEKTLKDIKKVSYETYIEFLIYFAIYPNHKFNDTLHQKLLSLELAIRDRDWTITINNIFLEENNLIKQIIDWTIKNSVPDESRKYYGKLLAWFLTSTNRELRDKATKALVNLYTNYLCEFLEILKEFENINDLYILERLYATLYGIVLRSENRCFKEVANYVYKTIFDKDDVIEHVLIREYASLTIKHILKFIKLDIDIQKINPPYNQHKDWTLPDISKEEVDKYKEDFSSIHHSTLHWDFKRYIIYPTFDDFLDLKIKERPHKIILEHQEKEKRYKQFFNSLTEKQQKLYKELEKNSPILAFLTDKKYDNSIEENFINSLNKQQKKEYLEFIKNYDDRINLPKINLKNIKRFIFLETKELGWKKEFFEEYEKTIYEANRYDKTIERIGKKYQWIAYYKTIAKVCDNYEIKDEKDWDKIGEFKGAYQLSFVRNIDPTTILIQKPDLKNSKNWYKIDNSWQCENLSNEEWLKSEENLPSIEQFVNLNEEVNLAISFSIDGNKDLETYRNLYYHIDSFLIKKEKLLEFTKWLKNYNFYGQDRLPQSSELYQIFLREYPFSEVFDYFNNEYYSQYNWTDNYNQINLPSKILLTTTSYLQESGGYDKSINQPISIMLPHKWIVEKMNLKQSLIDGEWVNNEEKTIIYDPSIKIGNRFFEEYRSLLANKEEFFRFLNQEYLSIIWIMWGEKQIRYKDWHSAKKNYDIGEICGFGYFDNEKFIEEKWICNKD